MSEQLKLKNQVCFKHYVISKEIIKKYRPFLKPLGLTYTGYITMLVLWEKDGISVKTLSEELYLDSGTLTPLLKKLENQGYVTRERKEDDERVVIVKLTERGRALKEKARTIPYDLSRSIFPYEIDEEELKQHIESLDEVMKMVAASNSKAE